MRILVIDDDRDMLSLLKTSLNAECFVVDIAEDGEKGEFMALTNEYDLIILDNMLPKKNGECVCKSVREKGKDVPIIMISVKSDILTKVTLFDLGIDDYLEKPFLFEELLARIRAILRRPKGITSSLMNLGDLSIDTRRRTVSNKGDEVLLTRKEYMLLELLARNVGEIVSRGMIWDHVWDTSADPFSNTIESHIRSLRKKLRLDGKRGIIETISGRGYRMKMDN